MVLKKITVSSHLFEFHSLEMSRLGSINDISQRPDRDLDHGGGGYDGGGRSGDGIDLGVCLCLCRGRG